MFGYNICSWTLCRGTPSDEVFVFSLYVSGCCIANVDEHEEAIMRVIHLGHEGRGVLGLGLWVWGFGFWVWGSRIPLACSTRYILKYRVQLEADSILLTKHYNGSHQEPTRIQPEKLPSR
jgi:hypothetical protein